ncbi:hypothetical protein [Longispora albida]|uniref:hypothetical protein n=1 Tax=Longispora albida TaxID=203523 RepID=UPI00037365D8|nr:hypothetical protein [Longispora albida]
MDRVAPNLTFGELIAQTPQVILDALPQHVRWKLDRLWALDLPVHEFPLTELDYLLDLPLWQDNGRRFQVTPRQVQRSPEAFPHHLARVQAADLAYPVHIVTHHGRPVILDGFHRLLKAALENRTTIPAMVLTDAQFSALAPVPPNSP